MDYYRISLETYDEERRLTIKEFEGAWLVDAEAGELGDHFWTWSVAMTKKGNIAVYRCEDVHVDPRKSKTGILEVYEVFEDAHGEMPQKIYDAAKDKYEYEHEYETAPVEQLDI